MAPAEQFRDHLLSVRCQPQPGCLRVVVVYPGRIATDFGPHALGQRTPDGGSLPAEVLAVIGGATQTAEEVAHVVCDAALGARGDVYTQPNAFAHVREYMETPGCEPASSMRNASESDIIAAFAAA